MIDTPLQESIVARTRQIDDLLYKLGGRGRNMRDRAHSVRSMLDDSDYRQVARIVSVNRGMVYDPDFRIEGDHRWFLGACDRLIVRLEGQLAQHATVPHLPGASNHAPAHRFLYASAAVAALLVGCLYVLSLGRSGLTHGVVPGFTEMIGVMALIVVVLMTRFVVKRR